MYFMLQTINGVDRSSSMDYYLPVTYLKVCVIMKIQNSLPLFLWVFAYIVKGFLSRSSCLFCKASTNRNACGIPHKRSVRVSGHTHNPAVLCNFQFIPQVISLYRSFRNTLCVAICYSHFISMYLILERYDLIAHTGKSC